MLINKDHVKSMEKTKITFLVQGSADVPYEVTFYKKNTNLTALCTCHAGIYGRHCKHRINILRGSPENIISENVSEIKIIESWLSGSDVEIALKEFVAAEKEFEEKKRNLKKYKKKLARAMRD
jgi:hypothetical protein